MLQLCPDLAAQNVSVAADHGGARLAVMEGAGHVCRPVQVLAATAVSTAQWFATQLIYLSTMKRLSVPRLASVSWLGE